MLKHFEDKQMTDQQQKMSTCCFNVIHIKKEQWKDFTRSLLLNDVLLKFLTRCPKIVFSVCIWFPQKYSIT